jgi:hypothetical protein
MQTNLVTNKRLTLEHIIVGINSIANVLQNRLERCKSIWIRKGNQLYVIESVEDMGAFQLKK